MGKLIGVALVLLLFVILFFPGWIPRLFRRLGRSFGDLGRLGSELSSGEDSPEGPLARYETRAGEILLWKIERTTRPSADPQVLERVGDVGRRVAAHARRTGIAYRFTVIESDEPEAFAIPGGAIFVSRPLVDLAKSDDELAGLLAHELSHVDLRHALYDLAARAAAKTGVRLLTLGRGAILRRMASGMEELVTEGYGRGRELEADRAGVRLAGKAGFDPRALEAFLRRLAEVDPSTGRPAWEALRYFRTHPPPEERIAALRGIEDEHGHGHGQRAG